MPKSKSVFPLHFDSITLLQIMKEWRQNVSYISECLTIFFYYAYCAMCTGYVWYGYVNNMFKLVFVFHCICLCARLFEKRSFLSFLALFCLISVSSTLFWRTNSYCFCWLDHCLQHPCQNGATCFADRSEEGYYCVCQHDYKGKTCDTLKTSINHFHNLCI